jgi:hypothetical protein
MSLSLNLESVILFLFFIAPGSLFTRTYISYRPRYYRPVDAFERLVLAIIGSVVIHATIFAGIGLGLVVYWLSGAQVVYLDTLFLPATPLAAYPAPLLALVILIYILYLALSLVLARRFATFLGRRTGPGLPGWWQVIMGPEPPEPFLLWHSILQVEPLQLNLIPPHLTVHMRNGAYFEGDLSHMRLVGDEENTVELALRNVVYSTVPPGPMKTAEAPIVEPHPLPNQVVLLKSTDILWLSRTDIPR